MSSRSSRTLYVGNLPGDIREREVEDLIYKVAIQCVTPRANLRWRESNSYVGDVNSDYSDLDSISEAADTTNTTNVGSSATNSIPDTSHARGLCSRETSSSTVRSHHSFDSMEDSFDRESSISNLSEVAVDLVGKPEPVVSQSSTPYSSVNAYESPKSSRSPFSPGLGKNSLNRRQDSGVRASPLRSFGSSVKPPKFYPADDIKKPLVNKRKARPTKLRYV